MLTYMNAGTYFENKQEIMLKSIIAVVVSLIGWLQPNVNSNLYML